MSETSAIDQIHPQLLPLAVEIASLKPDPQNARKHDERNIKAVMASIKRHGQRKPIVVQKRTNPAGIVELIIRAGNGTVEALKRMGWSRVAAVIQEEPDVQAKQYALEDNRTAELAEWDLQALGAEMRDLVENGVAIDDLGWEPFEYQPLMQAEWQPPAVTGEEFAVPEGKKSLAFTPDQWERLKLAMNNPKPKAEDVIAMVGAAREIGR